MLYAYSFRKIIIGTGIKVKVQEVTLLFAEAGVLNIIHNRSFYWRKLAHCYTVKCLSIIADHKSTHQHYQ